MVDWKLQDLHRVTNELWPEVTAESWDQVGLVTGANEAPLRRVLLAVDAVAATVEEALELQADALFTHHPLLLRGVHTVAESTAKGALLARLIRGECALIAAHTNADSPAGGVSDVIAQSLGLQNSCPIVPSSDPLLGIGRVGDLPKAVTLQEFARQVADLFPETVSGVRVAGDPQQLVQRVALCGGAGDSLLDHPTVRESDVYLTSDLRHHPAQESREQSLTGSGPALIDVAHWAAESLWLEGAAASMRAQLPGVDFVVSTLRTDPWTFVIV